MRLVSILILLFLSQYTILSSAFLFNSKIFSFEIPKFILQKMSLRNDHFLPQSLKFTTIQKMSKVLVTTLASLSLATSVYAGGKYPIYGDESIMSQKAHGTSNQPAQKNLRWNVDYKTADRISNYNRRFAEYSGYFASDSVTFLNEIREQAKKNPSEPMTFYDTNTGKPLFKAPIGRSYDDFIKESLTHGWPSFRDNEVIWDNVRSLKNGETVSLSGTHLGHNLPDRKGNRYCINLVSIAGNPVKS